MLHEIEGKKICVTGAGGFIGSAVVEALLRNGAKVRALAGAPDDAVRDLPREVMMLKGEITDGALMLDLMTGVDVVIHIAGPPSVAASFDMPAEYARIHVGGTATVLDACRRLPVRRLVYLSSAEVYGQPRTNPVREDHPLQARSPYGAAKIGAEKFIESFALAFALEAVILRPFSIYGPGLSSESLIGTILRQARAGDSVKLASLEPIRDYCHVKDLAEAILRACTAQVSTCNAINIGTGVGTSVAEVAKLILRLFDREAAVIEQAKRRRPASSDIHCLIADTAKSREVLGWTPTYTLKRGLGEMIEQMRRA